MSETNGIVVLAYGPQPIEFFSRAAKLAGKEAVLNQDVARMAGAAIAVGEPKPLADLHQRLEAGAVKAQQEATPGLSTAAVNWLASGKRGTSSNSMFTHLTGVDALSGWNMDYPHDPADFKRCRLLVEQVPELRPLLPRMAEVSPTWAALVERWDAICAYMDDRPSEAYDFMRSIIDGVRGAA